MFIIEYELHAEWQDGEFLTLAESAEIRSENSLPALLRRPTTDNGQPLSA
jgi:hypothetical protein